ncbi:ABC transporter, permease protein [[Actinomadura] parvosata subsp. kistnae]|uniref:MFS transporter n=1 Tax=[Actinomadura] parvosata subsp. kistnae TaxID=1909395 RepID=A0A1U9ZTZ1_9ACTN|nr:MFS transporter [Nonomuraea sp. ATCC 55076]AQZ61413.1 MFS transporter [Nonomuraea sp. ATCC 55076]SPL98101.1 ABC transporter, permease protein [Actinomadura parvosata subsp. kistnae]
MLPSTYRDLLRTPGAAAFFLTAAVGRVGIAMTSLGIVWLVHGRTGSYALAGLVAGGFAVAEAVAGPQLGRLIDRYGQGRVLPPVLAAHAASVLALLVLVAEGRPGWLMAAAGAAAGASIPQLGALSAARWSALLRDGRAAELPSGFALESLANGLAYLAGPVLVSAVGAGGRPEVGSVLAAGLVVGGGLALAAQRRTAPPPAVTGPRTARSKASAAVGPRAGRSLVRPGFVVLAGLNLAIGVFFGAMQVSVAAFAVEHGVPGAAAPLYAASSCGGLLTGWLYGLRRWRAAPRVQLVVGTAALALGCVPLLVAGSLPGMGVSVALTGMAVPPILVVATVLTEATVHRHVLTQAFTWLNSASAAGSAVAAAASGQAVDAFGAHGGIAIAAAATTAMAALAAAGSRTFGPPAAKRGGGFGSSAPKRGGNFGRSGGV